MIIAGGEREETCFEVSGEVLVKKLAVLFWEC